MDSWPVDTSAPVRDQLPARRPWRRSLLVSVTVHSAIALFLLGRVATLEVPEHSTIDVEPLVRGALASALEGPVELQTEAPYGFDAGATAFEPDASVIANAAALLRDVPSHPVSPNTLDELIRKASMLERISSPGEVSRMAAEITKVFGVREWGAPTSKPATEQLFDFNQGLLTDVTRSEVRGVLTYTETFTQSDGASVRIITARHSKPDGTFVYVQTLARPERSDSFGVDQETFDAVAARAGPFEIINSHPLVKQLHRQAVLPILEKLINEEPPPAGGHLAAPAR